MNLDDATRQRIDDLVSNHRVMLFMKGDRAQPQCGFSARVIDILEGYGIDYETLDVLSNPDVREGIKAYSSWPTIPQLYVSGDFVGGCDIITEMHGAGELFDALGVEAPEAVEPKIEITDDAAAALRQAVERNAQEGHVLHLSVARNFQSSFSMGPRTAMDVAVEVGGVTICVDRMSAPRADGIRISLAEGAQGRGFKIDNPNAPRLNEMSVQDLKQLIESGDAFELIDVRTPSEYETARIEGAQLLDEPLFRRLQSLPRETRLVFICHHGPRGVNAAEQFLGMGFTDVHNVTGGIHAWSVEIDPNVPQY